MKIKNKFFDLVSYILSFIFSIFRSFLVLFGIKKSVKKSYFLTSMDFVFRIWPIYFWKNPTLFKISSSFGMLIKYIFYNDEKNNDEKK